MQDRDSHIVRRRALDLASPFYYRALLASPVRQEIHEKNPHLEIVYRKSNGRHPQLIAEYVNGSKMPISLRNLDEQRKSLIASSASFNLFFSFSIYFDRILLSSLEWIQTFEIISIVPIPLP